LVARTATKIRGAKIHPIHQRIPPDITLEKISVNLGKMNIKNMKKMP
jgi:hypothetical protein